MSDTADGNAGIIRIWSKPKAGWSVHAEDEEKTSRAIPVAILGPVG